MKALQISKTLIYGIIAALVAVIAGILGIIAVGNNQSIVRDLPSNSIIETPPAQQNSNLRALNAQFITEQGSVPLSLEIAETPETQTQGLMWRTNMPENSGMLFVFENEQPRTFWMQNTLISLDIIYLDQNFEVVDIHMNTKTNQTQETYTSMRPSRFVVELNGGKSDKEGIKIGDRLQINL